MNTLERKFHLRRAALRSLDDCAPFICPELSLRDSIALKADYLTPTTAEVDTMLRALEADRLAIALPAERGPKWSLTDAGHHWLAQNP